MHLTEKEKDQGMSISELAEKCEVEKEVVQSQITFWIAKGVIKQRRGGARGYDNIQHKNDPDSNNNNSSSSSSSGGGGSTSSRTESALIRLSNSEDHDDEVHFFVIEEQAERALRDKEERPGGTGGTDEDLGLVIPDRVYDSIVLFFVLCLLYDDVDILMQRLTLCIALCATVTI
jgi:DNA-binding transcriptional MocR family regulator